LTSPYAGIGAVGVIGPYALKISWTRGSRAGIVETVDISSLIEAFKMSPCDDPAFFATTHLIEGGDVIVWDRPDLDGRKEL